MQISTCPALCSLPAHRLLPVHTCDHKGMQSNMSLLRLSGASFACEADWSVL